MEWPEVTADSSDRVILKKLESTQVKILAAYSSSLEVHEHRGKVTVVLHGWGACTYRIDTSKEIYEIRGYVDFIKNDKGCFITKLDAEDNATEGKLIRYEVSADSITDKES